MSTASDQVYAELRKAILAGDYAPESHLTAESVARKLGVSRTPVREGFRRLQTEGLLRVVANQGAFVSSWSAEDVAEIYSLRAVLEARAAELAASRLTHGQVEELRELAARMEADVASGDRERLSSVAEANHRFHRIIASAAGNRRLSASIATLAEMPVALHAFKRFAPDALRRSMNHHRELIAAFAERDAQWAKAAMECHVFSARATFTRAEGLDGGRP